MKIGLNQVESRLAFICAAVLVALYEEPDLPSNAMDYLLRHLGSPSGIDIKVSEGLGI